MNVATVARAGAERVGVGIGAPANRVGLFGEHHLGEITVGAGGRAVRARDGAREAALGGGVEQAGRGGDLVGGHGALLWAVDKRRRRPQ
jgi:hypothetical protein